jgi:hypothetical protein
MVEYQKICAKKLQDKRDDVRHKRKEHLHSKDVRGNQEYYRMLDERVEKRASSL